MPQIRQKLCQINQTDIFSVLMDSVFTKKNPDFTRDIFYILSDLFIQVVVQFQLEQVLLQEQVFLLAELLFEFELLVLH